MLYLDKNVLLGLIFGEKLYLCMKDSKLMATASRQLAQESSRKLDYLNQKIWDEGLNPITLSQLKELSKEVTNGTTLFERFPQAVQPGLSAGSEVLCSAAIICRGCPCTESETRPIYRTDDLIGDGRVQEQIVESWARLTDCWHEQAEAYLASLCQVSDSGTESKVFYDVTKRRVLKAISLAHYNVLRLALDRIVIHNALFHNSALEVFGFGRNEKGSFVVLVEQPYVEGGAVTELERMELMRNLGFKEAGEDYGMHLNYYTNELYVGDLNEYNLIKGEEIHIIDADCRLNVPTLGCGGCYVIPRPNLDFSRPFAGV
jgi:hypothetical protein